MYLLEIILSGNYGKGSRNSSKNEHLGNIRFCKLASIKVKLVDGKPWKSDQITSLQDCLGEESGGREGGQSQVGFL